jgi:hypothetical protein
MNLSGVPEFEFWLEQLIFGQTLLTSWLTLKYQGPFPLETGELRQKTLFILQLFFFASKGGISFQSYFY